ncbi:MAG TPA: DUF2946 family protein [Bradyrhizobium sp.]|nr:DUF2946 family protein [Bradyrhizobium sp.]
MNWFRDHIRRSSWLALIALAINLGLSFGHLHAHDGAGLRSLSSAAIAASDEQGTKGHQDGDQADLFCPICMAAGAIGHALTSAPPVLPILFAQSAIDPTCEDVVSIPQPPRAAFYSRGPPTS